MEEIEIGNFTARVPKVLLRELDDEADREQRSRNGQLVRILAERYNLPAVAAEKVAEEVGA